MGCKIPSSHPVISWIVQAAGDLLSKYLLGRDGKTPIQRLTGRAVKEEIFEMCEAILYRSHHTTDGKLAPRWHDGVWLGKRWESAEHFIGASEGVFTCRAVQRRPRDQRWNKEAVIAVKGTPWALKPNEVQKRDPQVYFPEDLEDSARVMPPAGEAQARPRRVKILQADLRKYGFTSGCPKCRDACAGINSMKPHSEACRKGLRVR